MPIIETLLADIPTPSEAVIEPVVLPVVEPIMTAPIIEQLFQEAPAPEANNEVISEPIATQPVIESIQEIPVIEETPVPVMPITNEATTEEVIEQIQGPSIMTEEIIVPSVATTELNDDMKMIADME